MTNHRIASVGLVFLVKLLLGASAQDASSLCPSTQPEFGDACTPLPEFQVCSDYGVFCCPNDPQACVTLAMCECDDFTLTWVCTLSSIICNDNDMVDEEGAGGVDDDSVSDGASGDVNGGTDSAVVVHEKEKKNRKNHGKMMKGKGGIMRGKKKGGTRNLRRESSLSHPRGM